MSDLLLRNVPPELQAAWNRHPEIVKLGHPILQQVAAPVLKFDNELRRLVERMMQIMREAHGLGLAAPQVGVSTRLVIYDAGEGVRALVNPTIVARKGEQLDPPEGCLSIPGLQGQVPRAEEIRVKAFDPRGRPVSLRVCGLEARVIQHEIDHLDGILFYEKAAPETLEWVLHDPDEENGNVE
jgi:peptide deformylase